MALRYLLRENLRFVQRYMDNLPSRINDQRPEVSIIVVTHNALRYCRILFESLVNTQDVRYEIVVVDNNSLLPTKLYLGYLYLRGRIHRLCLLNRNTLFAEGNNVGVNVPSRHSSYVLLLNSDIEVRDPLWLQKLLRIHRRGASSYGYVASGPWPRADGYCFLIERDLYLRYGLDEQFQWWWGITKLQAELLSNDFSVQAIREHDKEICHFGGKSGKGFRRASGMGTDDAIVQNWFDGKSIRVIDSLS